MTKPALNWPERRIDSLQEIQQLAVDIGARWPNADRCLFRGQSNAEWTLQPSLARELIPGAMDWQKVARMEREMANHFRQEAHRSLPQAVLSVHDYVLDWWPLMRHFGAPTRLLDWSLSPYVALYFAAEQRWDEDGALWWFSAATAENLMTRCFGTDYLDASRALFQTHDASRFFQPPQPMIFHFELKRTIDRIGNQPNLDGIDKAVRSLRRPLTLCDLMTSVGRTVAIRSLGG